MDLVRGWLWGNPLGLAQAMALANAPEACSPRNLAALLTLMESWANRA
jgi:hypothetical protein